SGIAVAIAPRAFVEIVPVLASPLSVGAIVAFLMNLFTLPMVAQRSELPLPLDKQALTRITDWTREIAGAWALRAQTQVAAEQSLCELANLLRDRGIAATTIVGRLAEDRIEVRLSWSGAALPDPPRGASPLDLV